MDLTSELTSVPNYERLITYWIDLKAKEEIQLTRI